MYKDIDLTIFPQERREKLENIYRYNFFDVVFYRSNLWMHSHRVLWLIEELIPLAKKYIQFDAEKARAYALVHDDVEMITGDVQGITKARMSDEEKKMLEEKELEGIDLLSSKYPKEINGYSYKELLIHAVKKDCIEAQLVSYVDKLDAYCESLHEVYAGNIALLRSVVFYANSLPSFSYKYPALKELLASKESPLTYLSDHISPFEIKAQTYADLNKPHTKESILVDADFPFYALWKKLVIDHGHTDWLVEQREFLK
jgi:5'-deoxynucleotidase YfbR-like HD superfamily hydrolase